MQLYEIDKRYMEVLEQGFSVDEETGEILFDAENMDKLDVEFNEKVDNIACYIKDLNGLSESIASEIKALQERKKQNDAKAESLKGYIASSMQLRNLNKLESARNKLSFRKSISVMVEDESKIDEDLFTVKVEKKLDKNKVKALLKEGIEVEGCKLVENTNLQIK